MQDVLKYLIAFSLIPGIGPVSARNIIAYFDEVEKVFRLKASELKAVNGIGVHFASQIVKHRKTALELAKKEINFINNNGIGTISCFESDFPSRLKQCPDSPLLLYYKGSRPSDVDKSLAVVGTRKCTSAGRDNVKALVCDLALAKLNPVIISGLAYGIDIQAHKSAMENNLQTWAVLGHGFDMIYPAVHENYAKKIIQEGGSLITEFSSLARRDKNNFLKRNRIIAGLSDAVVVVESALKGGSLVTASIANSYNIDVFAFPGRVNDRYSVGCNELIRTNRANLIMKASDLLYFMQWDSVKPQDAFQRNIAFDSNFDDNERKVLEILNEMEHCDIDMLKNLTGLQVSDLSLSLLNLEIKSIIDALPGKIFAIKSRH